MALVGLGRTLDGNVHAPYEDAVARAIKELEDRANGVLRPVTLVTGPYDARLGDVIVADTSSASISVRLPELASTDLGRRIVIKRLRGGNSVKVFPRAADKVNDTSVQTVLLQDNSILELIAFEPGRWITTSVSGSDQDVSGGAEPIWEWNGTDLTQFDSKVDGSSVLSSAISVVSAFGSNWIEMHVQANIGAGLYDRNRTTVIPMTVTPATANYRVEYDAYIDAASTAGAVLSIGSTLRWVSDATNGLCYSVGQRTTGGTASDIITRWLAGDSEPVAYDRTETVTAACLHGEPFHRTSRVDDGSIYGSTNRVETGLLDSTYTVAGKPALQAGISTPNATPTHNYSRFRNIKVWAL